MAKKNKSQFTITCSGVISSVISIYVFFMFLVFPLIYDNYYFNILETKTTFYSTITGLLLVSLVLLALIFIFIDFNEYKGRYTAEFLRKLSPKHWKQTFTLADAAVLAYVLVCVVSTLRSDYPMDAFLGTKGRYTGLRLNLLYVGMYFAVSRFWNLKSWCLETFLFSGVLVCLLGITDYFQMDILKFRVNISAGHTNIFASTIGNINTYTAFVGLVMGFAAAMFATSEKRGKTVWYYVCMVIAFMALITGRSDNAYLALGAMFALLPLYIFRDARGIIRYFTMVASSFTVVYVIALINQCFADRVVGMDGLFEVLGGFSALIVIVLLSWLVAAGLFFAGRGDKIAKLVDNKIPVWIWRILLLAVFLAVCGMIYDVNALGHVKRYGGIGDYLLFNDSWGTNRGYIWRKSLEVFSGFSFEQKCIGYGPDTFGIISRSFYSEMKAATGQDFDSVHNEYLQFLVTVGLLGLISYLTFIVSLCVKLFRSAPKNPYVIGVFCAAACYFFQAAVNINLPVVTPMLWLLMSCGMAAAKVRDK